MLTFSQALEHIKNGINMQRTGWNGKGMYIFFVDGRDLALIVDKDHGLLPTGDFLMMKTADNKLVPWLASQTDILANDWQTAVL